MILMEKFTVFPLRITSFVVGWLDLGTSVPIVLISLGILIYQVTSKHQDEVGFIVILIFFNFLFFCGITVILSALLLHGIRKNLPRKMLPWIIGTGFRIGYSIFLMIKFLPASIDAGNFYTLFLPLAILMPIIVYAYLAVYSYYQILNINEFGGRVYERHDNENPA